MSALVSLERAGEVAVVVIDNPPVNAGSADVRRGLLEALETVVGDDGIRAAVLIGAGNTFIAGSDLREFGLPLQAPQLPEVIPSIEACDKPVVAALRGAALGWLRAGAGLRCAGAAAGTVVGLPKAIELICSSARVPGSQALALGLIDREAESELRTAAVAHACSLVGTKARVRDRGVPVADTLAVAQAAAAALKAGKAPPAVRALIEQARADKGLVRRTLSDAEIRRRALLAMVNEAARLLAEGVARRASDVDVVLVNGFGFPRWEGGPVFWARERGVQALARDMDEFAELSGAGFVRGDLCHVLQQPG